MRVLAEFIMRGRAQAAVVALVGSWFPLISPSTVALVTLRRGYLDGMLILLWAFLPALIATMISDMGLLMPAVTIAGLLATFVGAQLLRNSSWERTLLGLVAVSCLFSLLLAMALPNPVAEVSRALGEMFSQMQAEVAQDRPITVPTETFVVGLLAYVIAVSSVMSLLLARWWQSLLYNPGGLQLEFHQLRLEPLPALGCFAAVIYCWLQGGDYQIWASVFGLPLILAGVAIVHFGIKAKSMGLQWLILFYIGLVMVSPLTAVLAILAVLDTWIDFRSRFKARSENNSDE